MNWASESSVFFSLTSSTISSNVSILVSVFVRGMISSESIPSTVFLSDVPLFTSLVVVEVFSFCYGVLTVTLFFRARDFLACLCL